MKKIISFMLAISIFVGYGTAAADWAPTKPVTVTIGFAPGSGNEISFRGLSRIVQENNPDFRFVIDNRPGADGVLGMNHFIRQPNDGHHVYIASHQGIWVTAGFFNREAKRFTLNDFEYGLTLGKSPLVIIASTQSQITTAEQMINEVRNGSRPISFAAGSGAHKLAYDYMVDYLKADTNRIQSISYRGPAQALADVAGGHVEFGIIPVAVANPMIQSGQVRMIALVSDQPLPALPNAPLITNYVPGMAVFAAWGILFPVGTDQQIINWFVREYTKAIESSQGQQFLYDNLMFNDPRERTPAGFRASMDNLRSQWVPVLERLTGQPESR